jgi:signal transduction histidine kinase
MTVKTVRIVPAADHIRAWRLYRETVTRFGTAGRWLDPLLAAALTVLGQVEVWSGAVIGGPRLAVAAVIAVGTAAVAFRRRAPLTVVVVCCGSLGVQGLLGVDSNSAFAPLFALFLAVGSAAFYARRPVLALIVAILLIWPVILLEKGLSPGDLLYAAVLLGLAWSVGRAFAVGRLRAQLAEQRAHAALADERVQIARELHDIIAHSISVMTLHAGGVRRLLQPGQQQERDALDVVEQTGRQALAELQRVLGVLRTPTDRPLEARPGLARVEELLESARATGLAAQLQVEGKPQPLPAGVDLSVYRIMQEALTNVLKHAGATQVEVTIRYDDGTVRLVVTDDGAIRAATGDQPGHGLQGMRERTALYGGTLEAGPLPGRGFRVAAVIPVPEVGR